MIEFFIGFLFLLIPAYAESIPDYEKPFAPIFTDKSVYSWTDKIIISVIAPSWNSSPNKIDSIGESESHAIKISSGKNFLNSYRLTETNSNSGIFSGEVTLTGFLHDVDGDGTFDTNPKTNGNGPTNGFLESDAYDSISISFEFADNVVLVESIPVNWNHGTIKFSKDILLFNDLIQVGVIDYDLNLNPEMIDTVNIKVFSDSDATGLSLTAIETSERSGNFISTFSLSENISSGNNLYAISGDKITAKYNDYTLPKPFSKSDSQYVEVSAYVDHSTSTINRIQVSPVFLSDGFGNPLNSFFPNTRMQIVGAIENQIRHDQEFIYFFQIKNSDDLVISLSWIQGKLSPNQILEISQSWIPTNSDNYILETYVWNSLNELNPLSPPVSKLINIQ
ncbi:MAG: hypothetical protein MT332_01980 [Candidatus Nitrosopumilus limneticus]|nr:hypothetical protein [Candidatus Nitrosopumilus limneticus]MDC4211742.1 hypothetical protein [Candidatus Nitrosopumilus limneticus]MDC4214550.1 hypothetical protein [Candidatus Nitrosopumilus limneticus]MDC4215797.1 hypothetical protein [Candidatus Nitrosopumilus limneticus]MDC4216478.1 hypothetical protein [Candidatus Nitrosopumilus limneticus]